MYVCMHMCLCILFNLVWHMNFNLTSTDSGNLNTITLINTSASKQFTNEEKKSKISNKTNQRKLLKRFRLSM